MRSALDILYRVLGVLACAAMLAAFACTCLSIASRLAGIALSGLDAYAGYFVAAALFLGMPVTFQAGGHIRVNFLLERLAGSGRRRLQQLCLGLGCMATFYLAYYAIRLVWQSHLFHDVSSGADATPLWIPQIAMALGAVGFALSLLDALISDLRGARFFVSAETPAEAA
ncbi:TRAP transporter small permease [Salipiger sp. PrR002]|uniref:TRAP transporter small permease n=1 Tax=Salipiger sp. PrR002 TaxID=2706489 RepID=UPI0013B73946|nr:TRAP transporter small permease [Salipiger sp. PrR002]NDW00212.1 TRAP transporter small permease [Salipiger sp. PrR002]NDW56779.1 TRAP transporter small permease [Salipiger sp. PrR004]